MKVQGKINAVQYCQILENALEESFENLDMPQGERIFQQDNDLKHTSKRAGQVLEDDQVKVLNWPLQFPDINSIEHLWVHVK